MCFTDESDWSAEVQEVSEGPRDEQTTCADCGCTLKPGDWRKHLWQQQYEECRVCEWEEAAEPCETHDYGESFACDFCAGCTKLRKAIEAVEADEGCPAHTRHPMIGELMDAMSHGEEYAARALAMFPEVAGHDFLQPWGERD